MLNILETNNWNLNKTTVRGELPGSARGLFPPFVKAYYSEQYCGRETSVNFYQDSEDLCWGVLYQTELNPKFEELNSGSTFYTKFIEIWEANRLVAVICGNEYLSPEQHIEAHRQLGRRQNCQRYKLTEYFLNLLEERGEQEVISWYEESMKFPSGFTLAYIKKTHPNYVPREITTLVF